jgi:hypothetical protein
MKNVSSNKSEQSWVTSASIFVLEGVKDHLKRLVGGAVVGVLVAVGLYVWSGQATWLLPVTLYLVSFIIGVVLTLIVLGFIGFRSVLQTRQQAAAFAASLASKDKGVFDYFVELDELQPEFAKTMSAIGDEMEKIASVAATIDLPAMAAQGSKAVVDGLGRAARRIIQHTKNMSASQTRLESLLPRMTEATGHQVGSAFIDIKTLPPVRTALLELRTRTQASQNAMTNWRTSQQNVYGMSQEMNTAVNHMIAVTDRILAALEASEERWSEQLAIIDSRLIEAGN